MRVSFRRGFRGRGRENRPCRHLPVARLVGSSSRPRRRVVSDALGGRCALSGGRTLLLDARPSRCRCSFTVDGARNRCEPPSDSFTSEATGFAARADRASAGRACRSSQAARFASSQSRASARFQPGVTLTANVAGLPGARVDNLVGLFAIPPVRPRSCMATLRSSASPASRASAWSAPEVAEQFDEPRQALRAAGRRSSAELSSSRRGRSGGDGSAGVVFWVLSSSMASRPLHDEKAVLAGGAVDERDLLDDPSTRAMHAVRLVHSGRGRPPAGGWRCRRGLPTSEQVRAWHATPSRRWRKPVRSPDFTRSTARRRARAPRAARCPATASPPDGEVGGRGSSSTFTWLPNTEAVHQPEPAEVLP